jgi:raffinose/stachyose/melibiose transport system substrate-binding protein
MTGKETELQKQLIGIFNGMTSSSGTPVLDEGTPEWKEAIMNLHAKLLTEHITPEKFVEELDAAADKAAQK